MLVEAQKTTNKEMHFLTVDQFEALKSEYESIKKWRDVPTGIIYKIESVEEVKTKKGWSTIVNLIDCDGLRSRAWATSVLSEDLKDKTGTCYIKPLEKKESTKNPGQFYYDYDLVEAEDSGNSSYDELD